MCVSNPDGSGRRYGSFLEAMNQIQNLVNCIKIIYEAGAARE